MITIIENTLRDGSYSIDFQTSIKNTTDVVSGLDKIGFDLIEVGHGLGLGAYKNPKTGLAPHSDEEYIRSAVSVKGKSSISAFFIPGIGTKEDIDIAADAGLDMLRVGINVNEFDKCRTYAEYAKNKGLRVAVNLMKSYAVKHYEFGEIVKQIDNWGLAEVIYLVDSAGCMTPEEVHSYLYTTKEQVTTELGFHGHNNLSLAAINSVEAIKAGASFVDTCVRGMGRSAGNAQTEIAVILLQKMDLYKHINIYELYDFANKVIVPMMVNSQGFSDEEIHIGYSKFHSSYTPFVNKAADEYGIDRRKLIKSVSEINCLNPEEELFMDIAKEL